MRLLTVAALTSHLVPDLAPLPAAAWRAISKLPDEQVIPFASKSLPGKDVAVIESRLSRIEEFEFSLQSLSEAGIAFTTIFEPTYPAHWLEKLGDKAPSHLFVAGDIDLLQESAVGIVGSRDVDSVGSTFTRQVAEEAARLGRVLISGGARGVDEIAMRAVLEAGGRAVGVLADSLAKSLSKWPIDEGNICLVSPFAPGAGFQVANAMARNKLIYAGSQATLVVSSALEEGGTWAGAVEALKLGLTTVMVRDGQGVPDGNRRLIQMGGVRFSRAEDLASALEDARPAQGSLL